MALYFDFRLRVSNFSVTEGLQEEEKDRIFFKNSTATRRGAKPDGRKLRSEQNSPPPEAPVESIVKRLTALRDGYQAVEKAIDERFEKIAKDSEDLVFEFNPHDRPDLADALARIFKGSNNKITYKMYLAALKLDKEISLQIGETLADGV